MKKISRTVCLQALNYEYHFIIFLYYLIAHFGAEDQTHEDHTCSSQDYHGATLVVPTIVILDAIPHPLVSHTKSER